MTTTSTTIRVSTDQRDRLRKLAEQRDASMADTFDAALEALRRNQFYADMAEAEAKLRADPAAWAEYLAQRDAWLNPDIPTP
jgi:predicted transcriptional regulator